MSAALALRAGGLSALVAPQAAALLSLQDAQGREYVWQGQGVWPRRGGYNVLFPAFGQLSLTGRYTQQGRLYTMPRHGFARDRLFTVTGRRDDAITLTLTDDAGTRAVYPFAFRLDVAFTLAADGLRVGFTVANPDPAAELIFTLGSHPAFNWPLPGAPDWQEHELIFSAPEPSPVRRPVDGVLGAGVYETPLHGNRLALTPDLFRTGGVFLVQDPKNLNGLAEPTMLSSHAVTLRGPTDAALRMDWAGFANLGLWCSAPTAEHPQAGFLCMEPFTGNSYVPATDAASEQPPELIDIPHLVQLPPGGQFAAHYRLQCGALE